MDQLTEILREQHGVLSRRQVVELGYGDAFIERMVRRKEWARVHRGVYVDHTGPLDWWQRAWAAVLFYWPAALCADSALRGFGLAAAGRRAADFTGTLGPPSRPSPGGGPLSVARGDVQIHVAVDQSRRVRRIEGVRVHRLVRFEAAVHPSRRPPTLRLEHSVVEVASAAQEEADAIAVIADACQSRRTTPERLARALRSRVRLRHRAFLLEVLEDVAEGAYSVLEHRYLTRVERPHGLPTGARQRRVTRGRTPAYRDVEYRGLRTVVELDGRIGHEQALDRWDDVDRDVDAAVVGDTTMRLGWRQALESCRAAIAVATVLLAHGWTELPRPCGPGCPVTSLLAARVEPPVEGAFPAPGAGKAPRSWTVTADVG